MSELSGGVPNKRRLTRHPVDEGVVVKDEVTGAIVGRLANIHTEGLMVMGDMALVPENLYQLSLYLPKEISGHRYIGLGVDCLWVRDSGSESAPVFWSGCQIIDCSAEARAVLTGLIEEMGKDG